MIQISNGLNVSRRRSTAWWVHYGAWFTNTWTMLHEHVRRLPESFWIFRFVFDLYEHVDVTSWKVNLIVSVCPWIMPRSDDVLLGWLCCNKLLYSCDVESILSTPLTKLSEEKLHTQINFNSIPKQHDVIIIEKTSVLNFNRMVLLIPTINSHRFPSTQFISHKQEVGI